MRRLFNIAALLSLLLAAATLVIWVLRDETVITVYNGGDNVPALQVVIGVSTNFVGIGWIDANGRATRIGAPLLLITFGLLVLPAWWYVRRRSNSDLDATPRCPVCGYNLTANTSGVCPECGTPIAEKGDASRVMRRLFNIAALMSLLLAVAIIWPWTRSHDHGYRAFVARKNRALLTIGSVEGRFQLAVLWSWPNDVPFHSETLPEVHQIGWGVLAGSKYECSFTDYAWLVEASCHGSAGTIDVIQTSPTLFLPFRFLVLRYRGIFGLLLILPVLWYLHRLTRSTIAAMRRAHDPPNICRKCGYNLTGNTSGVCPECGGVTPAKSTC